MDSKVAQARNRCNEERQAAMVQAEKGKKSVIAHGPRSAKLHFEAAARHAEKWERAEVKLNAALSEVASAVPYA